MHSQKPRPVIVLQRIAGIYLIIGMLLIVLNVLGVPVTNYDVMLEVGALLAGVQTYIIAVVVQSVFNHKQKQMTAE